MLRVIVVDDYPVVRRGLISILATVPSISVVGEAGSAAETVQLLSRQPCDVLLLDVSLPDRSGLDLLPELLRRYKKLAVILISQFPENQLGLPAIRAGAAGYLNKESACDVILIAVAMVAKGKTYLSPRLAELMANTLRTGHQSKVDDLSARETEVIHYIVAGHGISEIATKMGLSVKTVSTYRSRILAKIGGVNNAAIVQYTRDHSQSLSAKGASA